MSLNIENSIKETIETIKRENLRPAEEIRVAERLILSGLTLVLQHQAAGTGTDAQLLDVAYTVKRLADTLVARIAKG